MTEKRSLKQRGEDAAAAYLERCGIAVFERKWSCEAGSIDILAWDGDVLVLVDVKTGKTSRQGMGRSVSGAAARKVRRIAEAYIEQSDLDGVQWRYDRIDILVIAEDRALLRHHRDAIESAS